MVGIGIEELPLLLTTQGLHPSRPINPGTADLALEVVKVLDCLLECPLAVIVPLGPQFNRLVRSIDGEQIQQFLVDFLLGRLGQKRFLDPVRCFHTVGMVVRVLLLGQFLRKVV